MTWRQINIDSTSATGNILLFSPIYKSIIIFHFNRMPYYFDAVRDSCNFFPLVTPFRGSRINAWNFSLPYLPPFFRVVISINSSADVKIPEGGSHFAFYTSRVQRRSTIYRTFHWFRHETFFSNLFIDFKRLVNFALVRNTKKI